MMSSELPGQPAFKVNHLTNPHRFELHFSNAIAFLEYRIKDGVMYLIHTEVPEALQGSGVGGRLVQQVLKYVAEQGYTVVPYCPFARAYLLRHPEYQHLLKNPL